MNAGSVEMTHQGLVLRAMRRHAWMLVLPMLVLGGLGYVLGQKQDQEYQSVSRVLLLPLPGLPFAPESGASATQQTIALTTESQLVPSDAVVQLANVSLKQKVVPGDGTIGSSVPTNTQVVQVAFSSTSPESAQVGAGVVAKAFLAYRAAQATATQKARIDTLTKQAASVQVALSAASKAAAAAVPVPEAAQQVQLYAAELVSVQTSLNEAQAVPLNPGSVILPATLDDTPTGLNPVIRRWRSGGWSVVGPPVRHLA